MSRCVSLVGGNRREAHDERAQALYMQILHPGLSGLTSVHVTTGGAKKE